MGINAVGYDTYLVGLNTIKRMRYEKAPHVGSIFLKNLVFLNPYTGKAPETKTTDPTERRIKKMSDKRDRLI